MDMWTTMNLDLIELRQREKVNELTRIYETRDRLAELGYPSFGSRLRAAAATWLMQLAALLDERTATRAAETSTPVAGLRHA